MSKRTRLALKALSQGEKTLASPASAQSLAIHLFENEGAWESWLETHHEETSGIWLKISKKGSAVPTVSYNEALDVALCFGWIDGQRRAHDEQHFLQKFTPRRKNSLWSKRNVDKVGSLVKSGRMRQSGQAEIDAAKADGRWQRAYSSPSVIQVPQDFQAALNCNKAAQAFFDALNKTQRYSFLWRIETAKRPETRRRRIGQFIELLADHKTL